MAVVYCRVVNTALEGEPSHRALQIQDTLEIIEFNQITQKRYNSETDNQVVTNILDEIDYVIQNMAHFCNVDYNDNGHNNHTIILE
jgi:hypothetical protein